MKPSHKTLQTCTAQGTEKYDYLKRFKGRNTILKDRLSLTILKRETATWLDTNKHNTQQTGNDCNRQLWSVSKTYCNHRYGTGIDHGLHHPMIKRIAEIV